MIGTKKWRLLALAAAVLTVTAMAGPAVAAPASPGSPTGSDPTPHLVVPGSGEKVAAFTSLTPTSPRALPGSEATIGNALKPADAAAAGSRLKKADRTAAPRPRPTSVDSTLATQTNFCDEVIDRNVQVGRDASGSQILHVDYYGDVLCNFYLVEAAGVAGVIDRTPGYDGQILSVGSQFYFQWDYYGFSTGGFELNGDAYLGARSIEIIEELYLLSDAPWGACNPVPNLRYLACDGLGTTLLHVVVGTGPFSTGLQNPPPLFVGAGQGPGCPLTVSNTLTNSRDRPNGDEHLAQVGYRGTIACSTGVAGTSITGNSRAKLVDVPPSGNLGRDLSEGNDSGANGESMNTVTLRESEDDGRRVQVVYTGRSMAPAGRTWSGCNNASDGSFTFTRCDRNNNVVDWVAVGPVIDTGLPPDRNCRVAIEEFRLADNVMSAKGVASCDEALDPEGSLTLTVKLTGTYIDGTGKTITVPLPFNGEMDGRDDNNDGRADAEYSFNCRPSTQAVTYAITVTGRFIHPDADGGWFQVERIPDLLEPPMTLTELCMPGP